MSSRTASGCYTVDVHVLLQAPFHWVAQICRQSSLPLFRLHRQAIEDRHKRFLGCSGRPDSVSFKCHVAVRRLGLPGPIAPGDYFAVNNAAFMSTAAAVCTYLIVLMQFKTTIN